MKKSLFAALATVSLLMVAVSPAVADAVEVGVGTSTCSTYLSRKAQDAEFETVYFSWAQGYLSRMNHYETQVAGLPTINLVPSGFGVSQQIVWVNNYCATHTSSLYGDAVFELYRYIRGLNGYTS